MNLRFRHPINIPTGSAAGHFQLRLRNIGFVVRSFDDPI